MMRFSRDPLSNPEPLIRQVYAYVAYRIGDGPDAEDITSEAFERALRYRSSFDPKRGDPAGWLIGIARRCVDGRRMRDLPVDEQTTEIAAPQELESETIGHLTLRGAVASLSPQDRELIALRYGADLTARQIAEVLEMKTNAVEVALHRALARLRAQLEDPEELGEGEPRAASL
jgi:RNA polymerase sigma factor (sigma-70 family)